MNKSKLDSIERAARKVFAAVAFGEAEVRRRRHAVHEWLEYRARMRRTHGPAFLDSFPIPPPPYPPAPAGVTADNWRDALDAVATVGARMARRIGADDQLADTDARARAWAERCASGWRELVRPGDVSPYFLSEAAPDFPPDRERDAALAAVGIWVYCKSEEDLEAVCSLLRPSSS